MRKSLYCVYHPSNKPGKSLQQCRALIPPTPHLPPTLMWFSANDLTLGPPTPAPQHGLWEQRGLNMLEMLRLQPSHGVAVSGRARTRYASDPHLSRIIAGSGPEQLQGRLPSVLVTTDTWRHLSLGQQGLYLESVAPLLLHLKHRGSGSLLGGKCRSETHACASRSAEPKLQISPTSTDQPSLRLRAAMSSSCYL